LLHGGFLGGRLLLGRLFGWLRLFFLHHLVTF
jgi:hypothetical protein